MFKTALLLFSFLALVMIFGCGDGGGARDARQTSRVPTSRAVRLLDTTIARGAQGAVTVQLEAMGDENALGFSVQFDPTQLRYESAQLGADAAGASLVRNTAGAASGRLGFMLGKPPLETFQAGTREILLITFTAIDPGDVPVDASLTFTDTPVAREVVDATALALPASWDASTVSITGSNTPPPATPRHPADYNPDNAGAATNDDLAIDIAEITHYGSHWKSGQSWPRGPNPIEIAYLTNAGYLWRSGEQYSYEEGVGEPNCWVPAIAAPQARSLMRSSATARFSGRSYKGLRVTIELKLDPAARAWAVQEQPPAGWTVAEISHGGTFDAASGLVKWGPFFERTPSALSFTASPGPAAAGTAAFEGVLSVDGKVFPIGGERQSRVGRRKRGKG